jgi:hypothetical protein
MPVLQLLLFFLTRLLQTVKLALPVIVRLVLTTTLVPLVTRTSPTLLHLIALIVIVPVHQETMTLLAL